jgi:hypothetical protein
MGHRVLKPDQPLAPLVGLGPTEPNRSVRAIASNASTLMAILIMGEAYFVGFHSLAIRRASAI